MKMLVSMLFMGIVGNGAILRPGVALSKKERDTSMLPKGRAMLPVEEPEQVEDRISFEPDAFASREDENCQAVLEHFDRAQSVYGRMRLHLTFLAHRVRMAVVQSGPPAMKRAIDIVASAILLLALSPLFALIALLVKLEDRGPVFFTQTRVGRNGRHFKMYKVRSMCPDAEGKLKALLGANQHSEGVTFKLKDDPRITRIGKWLRKLSMDELPQLYNVLKGDMSLVGPRPPVPREVAKYSLADRRRLLVTPGITCIWQISGRAEIDFSGQVKLDVQYIENQNISTDINILLRTLPAVISGRGAC